MPVYSYICQCGHKEDAFRLMDDRKNGPEHCGEVMSIRIVPTHIMPDIPEYNTVAADKETGKTVHITGRKAHRDFLRRNGYEEAG